MWGSDIQLFNKSVAIFEWVHASSYFCTHFSFVCELVTAVKHKSFHKISRVSELKMFHKIKKRNNAPKFFWNPLSQTISSHHGKLFTEKWLREVQLHWCPAVPHRLQTSRSQLLWHQAPPSARDVYCEILWPPTSYSRFTPFYAINTKQNWTKFNP